MTATDGIPADAYSACFIIEAAPGERRAATSLVRRAIRKVLGKARCTAANFVPRDEVKSDARFVLDVTDEEFQWICNKISDMATAEGWERAPFDGYHDRR